jgi:allantoinase
MHQPKTHDDTRDLIGYGGRPPDPKWPDGARLALNFVVNLEEGSERCLLNGDTSSENYLTEMAGREIQRFRRDFFSESIFEYGARCGIWRLLSLFEARNLAVTVFACGRSLENPSALREHLARSRHELAGHGYRWIDYRHVNPDLEREHIRSTIAIIEALRGKRPMGWYTGRRSAQTRSLLVEAGILYDSESYSDDLPFWVEIAGKRHLVLPYTFDANDAKYFLTPGWMSGEDFLTYLKNTVRCLYREGKRSPKMMTVALHPRISGRPGRAEIVYRFLEFLERFSGIWVTTRENIALHWYQHHSITPR